MHGLVELLEQFLTRIHGVRQEQVLCPLGGRRKGVVLHGRLNKATVIADRYPASCTYAGPWRTNRGRSLWMPSARLRALSSPLQ
jgi:hypothetical protein